MILESFLKNSRLIFGESEFLPRIITIFFVTDSSWALRICIFFSLAPFPCRAWDCAIRRRYSGVFVAVFGRRRWSVHVDSTDEGSCFYTTWIWVWNCMHKRKKVRPLRCLVDFPGKIRKPILLIFQKYWFFHHRSIFVFTRNPFILRGNIRHESEFGSACIREKRRDL